MEECEATWTAMMQAVTANDKVLAREKYFLYHEQISNLEKLLGATIPRNQVDTQTMLFIFPPPENIYRN
jgi:hypothetical protein